VFNIQSESCVTDLNKELDNASDRSRGAPGSSGNPGDALRELLFKIPGNGGGDMSREMDGIERIQTDPSQGGKKPEDMTPQELHAILWQVLSFRDSVVKNISNTIEKIPGLRLLIDKLSESMSGWSQHPLGRICKSANVSFLSLYLHDFGTFLETDSENCYCRAIGCIRRSNR
jgi:Heterokaryon incompatibility protein Het-C